MPARCAVFDNTLLDIVEIPQAREVGFISGQLAEHGFANLLLRARHFPDSEFVHLASEVRLALGGMSGVAPQEVEVVVLNCFKAAGVIVGPGQHAVEIEFHSPWP